MEDKFPLEKVNKEDLEKKLEQLSEAFAIMISKEISSIQSDVQRILNVVQVGGVDQANRQ